MTIALELSMRLDELIEESPVPSSDALDALVSLFRAHRKEELLEIFQDHNIVADLQKSYDKNPERFEESWKQKRKELRTGYFEEAEKKLDSLTRFVEIRTGERSLAEKMHLLFANDDELLEISVAKDVVSTKLPGATKRAKLLREWDVKEPSSEQADRYLSEACSCFIYGFFTACAVMCRSLAEEVIERKLPHSLLSDSKDRTLGELLTVINNNLLESGFDREIPRLIRLINEIGSGAAHQTAISEEEALDCVKKTHKAISLLLS